MTEAKAQGQKTFEAKRHRSENPYSADSNEWADWMDGFDQAASDAAYRPAERETEA